MPQPPWYIISHGIYVKSWLYHWYTMTSYVHVHELINIGVKHSLYFLGLEYNNNM